MRRMMTAIGLGLSAVLLTGGCQLVGGGGNDAKPSKTTNTTTGGQRAQAAPSPQASSGTPPVTKSVTLPIPTKQGETYTLGFSSLRVKGQLAVLTLVWTPHGIGSDEDGIDDMTNFDANVALIDTANLKRYDVVSDSNNNSLHTDFVEAKTTNDRPLTSTFWFAAPPAGANINVALASRPLFESIPVTR